MKETDNYDHLIGKRFKAVSEYTNMLSDWSDTISDISPIYEYDLNNGILTEVRYLVFGTKHNNPYKLEDIRILDNDKTIRDVLNWVKSELADAERPKLSKYMTPYLEEKINFLKKLKNKLQN